MNNIIWAFLTVDLENMNTSLYQNKYKRSLVNYDVLNPLLDIFDQNGINAIFFASVFEYCRFDKASLCELLQHIESKGHDVQLHTHPIWCYGQEHMWQYSLKEQIEIIRHGKELIKDWLGKDPIAHRAGAYGANTDTLKALKENGIPIDSSMYFQHPNCKVTWSKNRIVEKDGIVEIPVTGFYRQKYLDFLFYKVKYRRRFIKTDINASTLNELLGFVEQARKKDIRVMNIFMHSYSLLRHDHTYNWFTSDGDDRYILESLLQSIVRDDSITFLTMTEFWDMYRHDPKPFFGTDHVPVMPTDINVIKGIIQMIRNLSSRK